VMSDNTSESAATTPAGGEAAPAPARRRRATRSVAAPDAVPTTAPEQTTTTPTEAPAPSVGESARESAPVADAPVKKAARKRTAPVASADAVGEPDDAPRSGRGRGGRKAAAAMSADATAAPASDAPAAPGSDAPGSDAPGSDAPSTDAPAEVAPKARKRATRPAAAATTTPDTGQTAPSVAAPVAEAPVADPAPVADSAPAAPARRRRASSRPAAAPGEILAVAPVAPVAEPVVEPVEDEDDAEATAAALAEAPALDVLAEFAAPATKAPRRGRAPRTAPVADPQPETPPAAGQPRLATTALLFQAPDPTASRQRRRRATTGAGSPEAISEAARIERDAETTLDETALEVVEVGDATDAPASTGNRNSRRRGRRGRGGEPPRPTADESADEDDTVLAEDEAVLAEDEAAGEVDSSADDDVEAGDDIASDEESDEDGDELESGTGAPRRRRRRGGRGRRRPDAGEAPADEQDAEVAGEVEPDAESDDAEDEDVEGEPGSSSRRRRRRRRGSSARQGEAEPEPRPRARAASDEVTALRGSTRLEAKRQRRREGRDAGRRRQIITEAEFLARRESVDRSMIVREKGGRTQIAVLEDGVLVEHYVSNQASASMVGNVYLGRVQNVLPSMEAAFVDVGKGRNAVLYAGEVNWDAANIEGGSARRIEQALKSGDSVLVQVTKDPIGHKGARLTSQVTLAGRYLVYVPGGGMTGISRKLPDIERNRLKKILREVVPDSAGVIVRTAAEGASEEELRADIARLQSQWDAIEKKSKSASAPALLQGEPDMAIRVVRDIFNDDFATLVVQGDDAWSTISSYIDELAPDLAQKVSKYSGTGDVFAAHRIDEQLAKGMDRKVWLPSGGSLVIDRTEAMTVVDVNTGKFTGSGGTLEETVTRNNLEAAEEIVRQLRLRDIGGMIVVDFIDMVLESNRDLVLRRLVECLGRDRTKHQVAEVTSLGLVQMTRKRVGQGLVEAFSETCEHCHGRGFIVHDEPIEKNGRPDAGTGQPVVDTAAAAGDVKRARRKRGGLVKESVGVAGIAPHGVVPVLPEAREAVKATLATIAAAAAHAHEHEHEHEHEPQHEHQHGAVANDVAQAPVSEHTEAVSEVADAGVVEASTKQGTESATRASTDSSTGLPTNVAPDQESAPAEPRAVLDVLAAFPDFEPGQATDAPLELTPVAPDLFEGDDDESEDSTHD
jgi:ribonuclease E